MALATFFSLAVSTSTAAVSQACQNETDALAVDSTILPLMNDIQKHLVASMIQNLEWCVQANVCNFEFNNITANLKLKLACVAAGGQIFISHQTNNCTNFFGYLIINFNNQAHCAGLSCDKDNVEEAGDLALDMFDNATEKFLGVGSTCRSNWEIEGSSGGVLDPGSSSSTTATGTALLVASVFLVFLV
eukprot:scaffold118656_cov49-Attheya_sp.AAC.1